MYFFDYCSGIGGGRLGLEMAGNHCVGHADTSRLSNLTYSLLFNTNEKNYGNIKRLNPDLLPKHDIMIAGFPCQSFSVIGKRDGLEDPRGQLVFRLLDIAKIIHPRFLIFENVRGLLNHNKGRTFNAILDAITATGYHCTYKLLNSLDFGVPQMRQRVYIVASTESEDIQKFTWPDSVPVPELSDYLIDKKPISKDNLYYFEKYLDNPTNKGKYALNAVKEFEDYTIVDTRMSDLRLYRYKVPTLRSQRDGIYYIFRHNIYELTGFEALLLQGFPVGLALNVKTLVSNRHLLMQAGNAMTVNVIKAVANQINLINKENNNGKMGKK